MANKAVYSCQACGLVAQNYVNPYAFDEEYGWEVKGIDLGGEVVCILVCPRCSHFPAPMVLENYQARIREGYDIGYH